MSSCTKHGHQYRCAACVQESADDHMAALKSRVAQLEAEQCVLRAAVEAYHAAVIARNITAYPHPDDRIALAKRIDETQEALFSLISQPGSGYPKNAGLDFSGKWRKEYDAQPEGGE